MKRKLNIETNCLNNKRKKIRFDAIPFNLIETINKLNQEFKMFFMCVSNYMEKKWDLNDILLEELMEKKNLLQITFEEAIQAQKIYSNNGEKPKNYDEDIETDEIVRIKNEMEYNFELLDRYKNRIEKYWKCHEFNYKFFKSTYNKLKYFNDSNYMEKINNLGFSEDELNMLNIKLHENIINAKKLYKNIKESYFLNEICEIRFDENDNTQHLHFTKHTFFEKNDILDIKLILENSSYDMVSKKNDKFYLKNFKILNNIYFGHFDYIGRHVFDYGWKYFVFIDMESKTIEKEYLFNDDFQYINFAFHKNLMLTVRSKNNQQYISIYDNMCIQSEIKIFKYRGSDNNYIYVEKERPQNGNLNQSIVNILEWNLVECNRIVIQNIFPNEKFYMQEDNASINDGILKLIRNVFFIKLASFTYLFDANGLFIRKILHTGSNFSVNFNDLGLSIFERIQNKIFYCDFNGNIIKETLIKSKMNYFTDYTKFRSIRLCFLNETNINYAYVNHSNVPPLATYLILKAKN